MKAITGPWNATSLPIGSERNGNQLALALVYDNDNKASYAASLQDATHMSGTTMSQGGGTSSLQFVKQ